MKFDAALAFYKTQSAIGRALGVSRQLVNTWKGDEHTPGVIPEKHAIQLQIDSKGKVKVDLSCYAKPGAHPRV